MSDFVLEPDAMVVLGDDLADDEFDDLLDQPAAAIRPLALDGFEDGSIEEVLFELTEGALKKVFDAKLHPRWPKGTPKAGEFMRVGDVFRKDGKEWQVVHVSGVGSRLIATDFSGKTADKIELKAKAAAVDGEGVGIPDIEVGKGRIFDRNTSPVVSPYVDPSTHDSSLAKPENSKLTDAQWQRFGRDDQEYYIDLQKRFGTWSPSTVQSMMSQIKGEYSSEVVAALQEAYQGNKGGSGFWNSGAGKWLNLAFLLKQQGWAKYAQIKPLYEELSELVHWDLYNRTKAPDIVLFHGGGGDGQGVTKYQNDYVGGKIPIYAGFSQSYALSGAESWGNTILATPTAIRYVSMSYYTPITHASSWSELEIAVGSRMKLDSRSVAFDSGTMGMSVHGAGASAIRKWLQSVTGNQPASGSIIEELKAVWAGKGHIPIPEEPLNLTPIAGPGEKYKPLPAALAAQAGAMAHGLSYKSDDGTKEASIGQIDTMGLQAGDFIEGHQGTRYVIIADPGDTSNGLRYVKITPEGKVDYNKSYTFAQSNGGTFYRLDGHIDIPVEKKAGFHGLTAEDKGKLAKGEKKMLNDLPLGAMFLADQAGYEGQILKVLGPGAGGKVHVQSLDSGKEFYGTGVHKAIQMVPSQDFTPPAGWVQEPAFKVGDPVMVSTPNGTQFLGHILAEAKAGASVGFKVSTPEFPNGVEIPNGHLVQPPPTPGVVVPEVGDKFGWNEHNYTITSILKNGTIRAKFPGGKVEKIPQEVIDGAVIYRPSTWALGNKAKAKELDVGDVVQGGAGAKIKPYMLVGRRGNKVWVRNLATGEFSTVTGNKSFTRLLSAEAIKAAEPATTQDESATLGPSWFGTGVKKPLNAFAEGDAYLNTLGQLVVVQKVNDDGSADLLVSADSHEPSPTTKPLHVPNWSKSDLLMEVYGPLSEKQVEVKPELGSKFDKDKWVEADKLSPKDMTVGTVFLSATGIPMQLKSNTPKGGATAVALHNGKTVKNISYAHTLTTLTPKAEAPFDPASVKQGDYISGEHLSPGDWFFKGDGSPPMQVVTSPTGDQDGVAKFGPHTQGFGGDQQLVYWGPTAPPMAAQAADTEIHADGLEQYDGYNSYLHPKSGKHKYPKLAAMLIGTVFTDKNGTAFKIKQNTGSSVVISDGSKLYAADPEWRGKADEDGTVAFTEKADMPDATPNEPKLTVGHLGEGDTFQIPDGYAGAGQWYKITDATPHEQGGPADGLESYTTITAVPVGGGSEEQISTSLPLKAATTTKRKNGPKAQPAYPMFRWTGEEPVKKADLPDFSLGMTSHGIVAYKAAYGNGWFKLGTSEKAPMLGMLGKVYPAKFNGPDFPSEHEDVGAPVPINQLEVGDFARYNNTLFQVIGKSGQGSHLRTQDGKIMWQPASGVQSVQPVAAVGSVTPDMQVADPDTAGLWPNGAKVVVNLGDGEPYGGVVQSYDPNSGTYKVNLDSGEVANIDAQDIASPAGPPRAPSSGIVLGDGQPELPPEMVGNYDATLEDLPDGAYYAFADEGGFTVKQITKHGPGDQVWVTDSTPEYATTGSPTYQPEWVHIPDAPPDKYDTEGSVPLDVMPSGTVFKGFDGEAYVVVASGHNSVTYIGPYGEHTDTGAATAQTYSIIPSLSNPVSGAPDPTPEQTEFFNGLATGDKLLFDGKPATVVDNTIPGTGILVKTDDDPAGFPGHLAVAGNVEPPGGTAMKMQVKDMPIGAQFKAFGSVYEKTGDLGGGTFSVKPAPGHTGSLSHVYNNEAEVVSLPDANAPALGVIDPFDYGLIPVGAMITSQKNNGQPYVVVAQSGKSFKFQPTKSWDDPTPLTGSTVYSSLNIGPNNALLLHSMPSAPAAPASATPELAENTQSVKVSDLPAGSFYQPWPDQPDNVVAVLDHPKPGFVKIQTVGSSEEPTTVPDDAFQIPAKVSVPPGVHTIPTVGKNLEPGDVFVNDQGDDPATLGWVAKDTTGHLTAIGVASAGSSSSPTTKKVFKVVGFEPTPYMPAFWQPGDVIETHDGTQAKVVQPMDEAGYMKFEHISPGMSYDGTTFGLYAGAILHTYEMHKVDAGTAPAANVEKVPVKHVNEMQVGDIYHVEDHGLTWQVVEKLPSGSAKVKLIENTGETLSPDDFGVGDTSNISGPINVTVERPVSAPDAPAQKPKATTPFSGVPAGGYFMDVSLGTFWKKDEDGWATLIADPDNNASIAVGGVAHSYFDNDPLVAPLSPDAVAALTGKPVSPPDVQYKDEGVANVPKGKLVSVLQSDGEWGNEQFESLGDGVFTLYGGTYNTGGADWTQKGLQLKVVGEVPTEFEVGKPYQANKLPEGSFVSLTPGGEVATISSTGAVSQWGQPTPNSQAWTVYYVGPPGSVNGEPGDNILKPYLHAKSGKYHYPKLSQVKPGSEFTDKAHKKFALIAIKGDLAVFEDLLGNQFTASKELRVKVTAKPPLSEARLVLSGSGRYLLRA